MAAFATSTIVQLKVAIESSPGVFGVSDEVPKVQQFVRFDAPKV
jgi:hypothetical protein